jgi:hypothetical protein
MDVHQGNVNCPLGDQTGGVGHGGNWSRHVRPARFKQALQLCADLPRIFDHQNTQAIKVHGFRTGRQ